MVDACRVTTGLLDALLELAATREPESVSALLAVTPAGELDAAAVDGGREDESARTAPAPRPDATVADLDPATPVFTDVYLPSEGRSVDAVFGMDVSVPHGQGQGRFVSHPRGELAVSSADDLHEVVVVAVPPWTREDVAAFDRTGRRLPLELVAAAPPEHPFEG